MPYGRPLTVGVKEGYIGFISDDAHYREAVPEILRRKMAECIEGFESGALRIDMPEF